MLLIQSIQRLDRAPFVSSLKDLEQLGCRDSLNACVIVCICCLVLHLLNIQIEPARALQHCRWATAGSNRQVQASLVQQAHVFELVVAVAGNAPQAR
jgi:hypothetical protein